MRSDSKTAALVDAYLAAAAPNPKSVSAFDPAKAAAVLKADKSTQVAVVRQLVAALTPGRLGTAQRPPPADKKITDPTITRQIAAR